MTNDDSRSSGGFDYVICGAGPSAAGLLMGLLESSKRQDDLRIAVVERGGSCCHDPRTRSLKSWCAASHQQRNNCSNRIHVGTINNNSSNNRLIDVSTGCGLGGTTLINAGLVVPPAATDFVNWPVKNPMDSVAAVLAKLHDTNCITHSTNSTTSSRSIETKLPVVENEHQPWNETVFPSCCIHVPCAAKAIRTKDGTSTVQRQNYYEALMVGNEDDRRVTLLTGYTIQRLLFANNNSSTKCIGVEASTTSSDADSVNAINKRYHKILGNEVILCTGTMESPVLLLAAGIGRPQDLEKCNISPRIVVPNGSSSSSSYHGHVGGNLRDHILLPRVLLHKPRRLDEENALNGVRAIANVQIGSDETITTKAQISLMDSAAYTDLVPRMVAAAVRFYVNAETTRLPKKLVPVLNILLHWIYVSFKFLLHVLVAYTPIYYVLKYCVTVVAVFLMNAESVGKITVTRRCQQQGGIVRRQDLQISIDLGYLSEPNDMTRMVQAWCASDVAYENVGTEVFPGWLVGSSSSKLHASRFKVFARSFVLPYFHWMGTCAMQRTDSNDDDDNIDSSVVDSDFRVRGVQNLRICDASIFPTLISAPPALTCAAMGHILGCKLIKEKT